MTSNKKKTFAIFVVIVLLMIIIIQGTILHRNFKQVHRPTKESRRLGNMGIYRWMTIDQISQKYGIEKSEVFAILNITPQPGDEKLDLRTLKIKYKKSTEEIKQGIHKILQYDKKNGRKL